MIVPWWAQLGAVGLVLTAVFVAGDRYGWSAQQYARCQQITQRRNRQIRSVVRTETQMHAADEARWAKDLADFKKQSVGRCVITGDQAAALNGVGD